MVIEDAATLRNLLTRLLRDGKTLPTSQQIDNLVNDYYKIRFEEEQSPTTTNPF